VRIKLADEDVGGGVLRKRKWNAAGEDGEDAQDRLKRPRTLRRFSYFDGSI
jgi:hypothetical protein